jgi:hypothetical protein
VRDTARDRSARPPCIQFKEIDFCVEAM